MEYKLVKKFRRTSRFLSLFLVLTFLSTSNTPSLIQQNFQPKNLAVPSAMNVAEPAPYAPLEIKQSDEDAGKRIQQASDALDLAMERYDQVKAEGKIDLQSLLIAAVAALKTPDNINALAALITERLEAEKPNGNKLARFQSVLDMLRRHPILAAFLLVVLLGTPGCGFLFGTRLPETNYERVNQAGSDFDIPTLNQLIRSAATNQNEREAALIMLEHLLGEEIQKPAAERQMDVTSVVRALSERLPNENNSTIRQRIIRSIGKALKILPAGDLKNEKFRELYRLWFTNHAELERLRAVANPLREQQEAITNRGAENDVLVAALQEAGSPFGVAGLKSFLLDIAQGSTRDPQLEARVIAQIRTRAEGTVADGQRTYNLQPEDLAALNYLYGSDNFSNNDGSGGKLSRLTLLRAIASFRSPESVPAFIAAVGNPALREAGLDALIAYGTPDSTPQQGGGAAILRHRFAEQQEAVTNAVLTILLDNTAPAPLRAKAGQIMNLMRDQRVAIQLQPLVSDGIASVGTSTLILDVYVDSVQANHESLRGTVDSKTLHGAALVQILGLEGIDHTGLRTRAVRAIQALDYPQAVNHLLLARMRARHLKNENPVEEPEEGEEPQPHPLDAELAAINEALTALGYQGNYASLKERALDGSAAANVRVAMIAGIQELLNGENPPAHSAVATDLAELIADSQRPVQIAAINLFARLNITPVDAALGGRITGTMFQSLSGTLTVYDVRDLRIAVYRAMRALNISFTAEQHAAVLTGLSAFDEAEFLLVTHLLVRDAGNGSNAAQPQLTAIAQDTDKSNAMRDRAVETILALRGNTADKAWLERTLLPLARDGSVIKERIEVTILKADWTAVQRSFYDNFSGLSGSALAAYLQSNIPSVINHPSIVDVLKVNFRERSRNADKVALALALIRMGNNEKMEFLIDTIEDEDVSQSVRTAAKNALLARINDNATPTTFHQEVLDNSPEDVAIVRAALTRLKTNPRAAALPVILEVLEDEDYPADIAVLAAQAIGAAQPSDARYLQALQELSDNFNERAEGLSDARKRELRTQLIAEILRLTPGDSGDIGRGDQAVLGIWKSATPVTSESIQAKTEKAVALAVERLTVTEFGEGIPSELAEIAVRRLRDPAVSISAYNPHVEAKNPGDKTDDLFSLGFGTATENRVPSQLFEFEEGDEKALVNLARALTHEALEGAKAEILTAFDSLKKAVDEEAEALHRFIINEIEVPAFSDSDLPEVLRGIIQSQLEANQKIDQIPLSAIIADGDVRAEDKLAEKALEFEESEADIEATVAQAFSGDDVPLEEKITAGLILPADYASPLETVAAQALESDALIVLDAGTLNGLEKLPETLNRAVTDGKVLFLGETETSLVPEGFVVKDAAELEAKAAGLKQVDKIAVLASPELMRAHFTEYGPRTIAGKTGFVAPIALGKTLAVHLVLANELIRVNFDVRSLSDAAKLLLALELEPLRVEIDEMRSILTGLGQIPSEIIRDAKQRLNEDLIGAVINRIAA